LATASKHQAKKRKLRGKREAIEKSGKRRKGTGERDNHIAIVFGKPTNTRNAIVRGKRIVRIGIRETRERK